MDQKLIEKFYSYHSMNYYEVITHKSIVMHTLIHFQVRIIKYCNTCPKTQSSAKLKLKTFFFIVIAIHFHFAK